MTSQATNWNSCQSPNPWLSQGESRVVQPILPRRGYGWNVCQIPNPTPTPRIRKMKEGESSICSPYPCAPRSVGNIEGVPPEHGVQGKGSKNSTPRRRCGKTEQSMKEELPTTWSHVTDHRSAGMPPPERIVWMPNKVNGDLNSRRSENPSSD